MVRRDLSEVLAIEAAGFDHPWDEEEFLRNLRRKSCIGMVAELGERIVGFMVYELQKDRLEVLDFAVHPDYRGRGVGCQMVEKLAGKLSSHYRTSVVLNLRETNLNGQLFFKVHGFEAVEVAREHYQDTREDAYVMRLVFREGMDHDR